MISALYQVTFPIASFSARLGGQCIPGKIIPFKVFLANSALISSEVRRVNNLIEPLQRFNDLAEKSN